MISLKIADVKDFMGKLLMQSVFDNFYLSEMSITTFNQFTVNGRIMKDYFSSDELETLEGREYSKWSELRPMAYELIKGKKTPSSFKIVLLLSPENSRKILSKVNGSITCEQVNGLFLNIKYEHKELTLITGVSLNTFTMDKTLDYAWDDNLKVYLKHFEIGYEEL